MTQTARAEGNKTPHLDMGIVAGVAMALVAAGVGFALSQFSALLSPLLVAILLGVVVGNTCSVTRFQSGLDIAGKRFLRIGIVLLGLQLSLSEVASLGIGPLVIAIGVVLIGMPVSTWIGCRLGLKPAQAILTGSGFSICGAAAVAAADGVVEAEDEEVATSVALVVIFGTLMIPIVAVVGAAGFPEKPTGIWAGASVHEVAQVVAAAALVGHTALSAAVLVKLARVLMLAPVMVGLGVWRRRQSSDAQSGAKQVKLPPIMPLFVAGFIVAVLVRTFVTLPTAALDGAKSLESLLLAAAMFALGVGVKVDHLKKVGGAPIMQAVITTVVVSVASLCAVAAFVGV